MDLLNDFLEFELFSTGDYSLKVSTLVLVLLIVAITRMVLWIIKKSIFRRRKLNKFHEGNAYSLFRIIKYLVWVIAIGIILETLGVKVSLLIAGSAALLVGVGLGLQQTFNDVISGIIYFLKSLLK